MLSRSANDLFWMSRHVERAEEPHESVTGQLFVVRDQHPRR